MLFVESKSAKVNVSDAARLDALARLQNLGFQPLIREARLRCFELALPDARQSAALERLVAAHSEAQRDELCEPYTRGDVFPFEDHALFLIFDEETIRAGIVYEAATAEPQRKLEDFCRRVQSALADAADAADAGKGALKSSEILWRPTREEPSHEGVGRALAFKRAEASETLNNDAPLAPPAPPSLEESMAQAHAAALLQSKEARHLLTRLLQAQAEGRVVKRRANAPDDATAEYWVNELTAAGLLRREVLVSCRVDGRGIFRLPSLEALAGINASGALCIECGRPVADERAEELIAPTALAAKLLGGGAWLVSHVRGILNEFRVGDASIVAQESLEDFAYLLVDFYGELFLILVREGDWTTQHVRNAIDLCAELRAAHLVVVTTGSLQPEARVLLRGPARRCMTSDGSPLDVIICEGFDAISSALEPAFERVTQRAICGELCALDSSLGFSVGHMLSASFHLRHHPQRALDEFDLAAPNVAQPAALRSF